jgi:hypothetical protein
MHALQCASDLAIKTASPAQIPSAVLLCKDNSSERRPALGSFRRRQLMGQCRRWCIQTIAAIRRSGASGSRRSLRNWRPARCSPRRAQRAKPATAVLASGLHRRRRVSESKTAERRRRERGADRRKHSRSGRRTTDPHGHSRWRRLAWMFAGYAAYLSLRSIPAAIRRLIRRDT